MCGGGICIFPIVSPSIGRRRWVTTAHSSLPQYGEWALRTADLDTILQVKTKPFSTYCPALPPCVRSSPPESTCPPARVQCTTKHSTPIHPLHTHTQVYYRLPPPSAPLDGEYLAEQLDAGPELLDLVSRLAFNFPHTPGFWVGKGFVAGEAWAYNLFLEQGVLVRK